MKETGLGKGRRFILFAGSFACISAAALAPGAGPQAFEAVSVKTAVAGTRTGCRGGPGTSDPGLLSCGNFSLSNLVMMAFDLRGHQFRGQGWMETARYDVSAKIPPGATISQFRSMLQNLLVDRFRLAFHYKKVEMAGYDLTVAPNGPKLTEAVAGSAPANERAWDPPISPPARTLATKRGMNEPMATLVNFLSDQLGGPVADATGLQGLYDYTLSFMAEPRAGTAVPPSAASAPGIVPEDDFGSSLVAAVKDQLGLRLVRKKALADVLIVDHAEKAPTEN